MAVCMGRTFISVECFALVDNFINDAHQVATLWHQRQQSKNKQLRCYPSFYDPSSSLADFQVLTLWCCFTFWHTLSHILPLASTSTSISLSDSGLSSSHLHYQWHPHQLKERNLHRSWQTWCIEEEIEQMWKRQGIWDPDERGHDIPMTDMVGKNGWLWELNPRRDCLGGKRPSKPRIFKKNLWVIICNRSKLSAQLLTQRQWVNCGLWTQKMHSNQHITQLMVNGLSPYKCQKIHIRRVLCSTHS